MTLRPVLDAFGRSSVAFDLRERLPARGTALRLGGLPRVERRGAGRLARRRFPQRLLTVRSADARRRGALADRSLSPVAEGLALYPQREALGEDEPHYEIAGERVETIAALLEGRLRVLVTTARATVERTMCRPPCRRFVSASP